MLVNDCCWVIAMGSDVMIVCCFSVKITLLILKNKFCHEMLLVLPQSIYLALHVAVQVTVTCLLTFGPIVCCLFLAGHKTMM